MNTKLRNILGNAAARTCPLDIPCRPGLLFGPVSGKMNLYIFLFPESPARAENSRQRHMQGRMIRAMDYVFMTDSDSDLPYDLKVRYDIPVVYMPYTLDGKQYYDDLGQSLDHAAYFQAMRDGAMATTSALNKQNYLDYFEPILREKDLLFIAFSSQMSMTIREVYAAREELLAKYPERKFIVVDTLSISVPMTLLVLKAHELYRAGKPIEEVAKWVEDNRTRAQAFFTVDDLKYLRRGGRISATAAVMGNMLDLKPIIVEGRDGKLISVDKVRGRKKAVNYIVEHSVEQIEDQKESIGVVLHADAAEEAERMRDMLQARLPEMTIRVDNIGPVIGAHCGPGTLAFCFLGKERPY